MSVGRELRMPVLMMVGVLVLGQAGPVRAEMARPAELPPPDYAGQQYVDSKGCLFVRAGQAGTDTWLPRVTRDGVVLCDNPPSGQRVPVEGDGGTETEPAALPTEGTGAAPAPAAPAPAEGFFVAVENHAVARDAKSTLTRLRSLNYPAFQGRLPENSSTALTVFAGPFPSRDEAERALQDLLAAGYSDAVLIAP